MKDDDQATSDDEIAALQKRFAEGDIQAKYSQEWLERMNNFYRGVDKPYVNPTWWQRFKRWIRGL